MPRSGSLIFHFKLLILHLASYFSYDAPKHLRLVPYFFQRVIGVNLLNFKIIKKVLTVGIFLSHNLKYKYTPKSINLKYADHNQIVPRLS